MAEPIRVLIVEDAEDDAALVLRELRRGGYDLIYERVDTREAFNAALDQKTWDIIISDYTMPNFRGTDALEILKLKGIDIPFIFVSGTIGEDTAVDAMKNGAHDYIIKGNLKRLLPAVERELREAKLREEQRKAEETINYLAYHDVLTGLPNRTALRDQMLELILTSRLKNESFALLMMNMDRFKEINFTLGYQNGDILLKQVKERLHGTMRDRYTAARMEGDKFAVLISDIDADGAMGIAGKIIKAFEKPFVLETLPLDISVSIGIAIFPGHGEDADTLLRRGDIAMHMAKNIEGGFCLYSPQYDQYSTARLGLMTELRHAIEEDQLFLLYQPKIDLRTGQTIGLEALCRWNHPKSGIIPPDQFISLAESTGLIRQLTLWVIKEVLRQSRNWRQTGIEVSVAVNISAKNLQTPQLLDQLEGIFSTWGVVPGALRLEITESVIMADPQHAMDILKRLTNMGMHFSIDDFGTGYSSLGYLQRLPVDELKIDKSFVMNMLAEESSSMIVHSIIELAHNLRFKVVAEGVENKETLDRLALLGCDYGQGYFISKPIPPAEITAWFDKQGTK